MARSTTLRVGFAGTPTFATPALKALFESPLVHLACVYTQPDRPAGRGRRTTVSPVKQMANEFGIPVLQPANFSNEQDVECFAQHRLDVLVVAAYGLILPKDILTACKYPINIHASLLPRWRGAAPMQRAIMAGDHETGITIIRIVEKLDAGPMWNALSCPITPRDTAGTLHDKLAVLGAEAIETAIESIVDDKVTETPQQESLATYAKKISAADRELDWNLTAEQLARQIRALNPSPTATANLAAQQCKIWSAEPGESREQKKPGTIAFANAEGIGIHTSAGVLNITLVQPPGKKPMTAADFLNGYGERLGTMTDQNP
ncbi:MAG: methionyl-tRNA formyltransferase [Gammaproteobacteria bacterium]